MSISDYYNKNQSSINKIIYLIILITLYLVIALKANKKRYDESVDKYEEIENERLFIQFDLPEYRNIEMQNIKSSDESSELSKFFIASSYKSYCLTGHTDTNYSYKLLKILLNIGVRFINLDVFNTDQTKKDTVLGVGNFDNDRTEYLNFKDCLNILLNNAWNKNQDYPLILFLNIDSSTYDDNFKATLDSIINKVFGDKIFSPKDMTSDNINNITYKRAKGKVLLLCNVITSVDNNQINYPDSIVGYIDSNFSEIVNNPISSDQYYIKTAAYEYDDNNKIYTTGDGSCTSLYYDENKINIAGNNMDVYKNLTGIYTYSEDTDTSGTYDTIKQFSVMIPEILTEKNKNVVKSDLINPNLYIGFGYNVSCICMNYQLLDTKMAYDLNIFKKYSFIPKKYQI